MANPFYLKEIPVNAPYCNRQREMAELKAYAESRNNVVIYSPRRQGKTSLVRRVQKQLAEDGAIVAFADFYGVGSVDDVAGRLAEAVFRVTRPHETVWKTAIRFITSFRPVLRPSAEDGFEVTVEHAGGPRGLDLLRNTLRSLGQFVQQTDHLVCIALDEFQDIVTLPDSGKVEAVMRTEIQQHQASYFFIGSQRRMLKAIFDESERPFFRSAFDFQLHPLPEHDLAEFIGEQFRQNGKTCDLAEAQDIVRLVGAYAYYAQKICHFIFERSGQKVIHADVQEGFRELLSSEKGVFEARIQTLPSQQRLFLRALAIEPTKTPYGMDYMRRHNLGSTAAVRNGIKQLDLLDYIECETDKMWRVVDPVFVEWLSGRR